MAYLTAGIDSQLDRYEMRVWGWGPGEESWLIDRQIIMGRHDDEQTLLRVDEAINKTYTRRNGAEMSVSRICWDTGGIDPTIVYERSKKHGLFRVIPIMRDALDARKSRLSGGRMTKETQSTTVSATASQADVTDVVQATEGENASAAQPDVNAQITAAVAAENSRIMGILNCEEAHGREEQARVLAETPGMTVETARRILAAAPQSAQARSDTALDRLMQGAPAPLAAGNPASDAVNDLLNTPV
ncbi:phage terminase large subunit family protein [Escherichia coli]|nr:MULTISPECIES: terminase gpA endonuclease subunit [Enterobacteriaceae]EEW1796494.1 phage terminase large subunit family protein [Escherichia coli]EFD5227776.1 phage terminase large subunit family protein [Escherichia coli]EFH2518731.1 phage terminase large subunit family protein [Escherichia coli]EFJ6999184.1 phage terminase large subunit family protein [Escherichia coli]EFJ7035788.1 phage terminase large subunit family protein [Escherichia coli]